MHSGENVQLLLHGLADFSKWRFEWLANVDIPKLSADAILLQDDCFDHAISVRFSRTGCSFVLREEATALAMFVKKRIGYLL